MLHITFYKYIHVSITILKNVYFFAVTNLLEIQKKISKTKSKYSNCDL